MSSTHLTRRAACEQSRYPATTATLAQKIAGLQRVIQKFDSLRDACTWVNKHSRVGTPHVLTKSTLQRLHRSLPPHLLSPYTSSSNTEVEIMDFIQQQQTEQRQNRAASHSLLTDLEDDLLVQWIQARGNMNLCPEKEEIIDHARLILLRSRNIEYDWLIPSHTSSLMCVATLC
jgi:hypothetical protein